jgi:hypothetical protein
MLLRIEDWRSGLSEGERVQGLIQAADMDPPPLGPHPEPSKPSFIKV